MNQPQSDDYDLSDYDPDEELQFRQPPQVLAIVTLILGCLSFLAMFSTTFWIFPIVTIALGAGSLISLARNPTKIGRKAALIGLMFAVFFGTCAVSRYFSRQQWLCRHACQNAEIWFQTVKENRLRDAHQLHLHASQRAAEGVSMDDYYQNEEYAQSDYDTFFSDPPMDEFVKVAPQATFEFVQLDGYYPNRYKDDVVVRYVAQYELEGKPRQMEISLVMRRNVHTTTGESGWSVHRVRRPSDLPK